MALDVLVGAIDFGTTYSGWALLYRHEFESDPTKGNVKTWNNGTQVTEKTPTVVLIKPDGKTLAAFGYEAEDKYSELILKKEHISYFYFRHFKMMLYKKLGETLDIMLKDEMGKQLPALDVFSLVIQYLVEDAHKAACKNIKGIQTSDIHWVLTVPAIWTDSSKNFMRQAAEMAGIQRDRLSIALEPEVASIYCRKLPVSARRDETGVEVASFPAGTKYIMLDAGGGTVDITVHEVQTSGTLKEVIPASGGAWGGTEVDRAFEDLIISVVGSTVYDEFKREMAEDWYELWRDFELKKRKLNPENDSKIVMRLPLSLQQIFKDKNIQSLKEAIEASVYRGKIELSLDKIKIEDTVFKNLFNKPLVQISQHIENILTDQNVGIVQAILMVGGFSDSPMLQQKMTSTFSQIAVIIPRETVSSIMRGALIFGHSPKSISERVLKFTYGVNMVVPFVEGEHPESKRIVCDSGVQCKDIFDKHAEKGQIVKVGEPQRRHKYHPLDKNQKSMFIPIFASESTNPRYTDVGCTKIGEFTVKIPDHEGDFQNNVWISFTFSGTEIEVEGEDEKTGKKTKMFANFSG